MKPLSVTVEKSRLLYDLEKKQNHQDQSVGLVAELNCEKDSDEISNPLQTVNQGLNLKKKMNSEKTA